ncbi:glycosyltransferase family 2 protein [Mesorhizobium sp. M1C.F.Ca.ET.193.01.1.1]|uniref:glycosyltransferase family 2 protein n=2 Tax=Mesorhizobium TaxID=68287 RepID=UPI000FD343CA|nr:MULTISPECIES: glycosyltransferase family 2 protein [unclassified Mesorhizobium]TGS93931.1 glycosyltransferase family 2 protein [bacterium M00.F.Ca.ET.177.01.1.1]TGQ50996.1 glycosyltransferase family 2 protein [Mesorhizobium sp. M1C.F.Ca.ET.210.01.1.1]TGQ66433.1 glycosyltransferase family 2 protein [Mesorhizobium sp. M1C.F.Ca.ET.212.01.1.1]TGR00519.1 glycosyltransferase family 2 protein [Mesorhizobium sp. M1C.F.Ca.ET.204.01.1.1]TGR21110.1 glycosyltransferase family 2 protein [Mesorhizobium s
MVDKSNFATIRTDLEGQRADDVGAPLVSAIIPCLNEERTLGICIRKALDVFAKRDIKGEVVVGDNGSTDRSVEIAESLGARVVHQRVKGYGAAISAAAEAARGKYLIMADADDSYDWSSLGDFIDALEGGAELVMGDRFAGGIEPGAMPALHRYLGNPVLSTIARWLHHSPIHDFHCGMRGFTRDAFRRMGARSPGMEFASEMVINAHRAGLVIREVPIKLYPDKRGRPPHLRSFRDGWRHLRLIVAHAPNTMYLIPGATLLVAGVAGLAILAAGPIRIGGWYFGIHFVALSAMATLIGLSAILFGMLAKVAIAIYHPVHGGRMVRWLMRGRPLEWLVFSGGMLAASGFVADVLLALHWIFVGGPMEQSVHLTFVTTTACVAGMSMVLSGFVLKLLLDNLDDRRVF